LNLPASIAIVQASLRHFFIGSAYNNLINLANEWIGRLTLQAVFCSLLILLYPLRYHDR
jgi:hypothetical protein